MARHTLAIHPGALGDVLLAIPALRALRAECGAVTLAAQPRIGALLGALGEVDHAIAFDTLGLDALFTDAALPDGAPVVRRLAGATRVVCWFGARDPDFVRRLRAIAPAAVVAPPAATPTLRVWQHLLRTVTATADGDASTCPPGPAAGTAAGVECAAVIVSALLREQGRQALRDAGWDAASRVLVVHPGAGGTAKRWPVDGFADVIAGLAATIVVHEGPADAEAARALVARVRARSGSPDGAGSAEGARGHVLALVGPGLPVLAGVLAEAAAYVGNDSGISHLAAAVGTPSVVLFTSSALPWVPWSPAARCLTVNAATVVPAERDAVRGALAALT